MHDVFHTADVPWAIDELAGLPQGSHVRGAWRDLLSERFDAGSRAHLESAFAHRGDPDVAIVSSRLVEEYDSVDDALVVVQETRARRAGRLIENRGISTRRLRELPPLGHSPSKCG